MSKSKSYILTDDGLDRLNSAINRAFNNQKLNLNDREDIYRSQRSSLYNYLQLKNFFENHHDFKIGDETLKFILERTAGVKVKTIESIFNVLTEFFSNNYIELYQNRLAETSKNTLKYHNLPVRSYLQFVGRTTEIEEVLESIRLDKIYPQIVVIEGKRGIGKTALVNEIAYRCQKHGEHNKNALLAYQVIIYIDFQKKYKNSILNGAINNIFRVISQTIKDDSIIRTEEKNRAEKACNALKNYKTLLIIDNFQNINKEEKYELSDFLVSLPTSTKVIITSQVPIMMIHQIELKSMANVEIKEIMDTKLKLCGKNFDIDPVPYVGNPLTAITVVDWTIEHNMLPTNLNESCPIKEEEDDNSLCFLSQIIDPFLEDEKISPLLMTISIFHVPMNYDSLLEISGIEKSSRTELLLSKAVRLEIVRKNENEKYFIISGMQEYILSRIMEDVGGDGDKMMSKTIEKILHNATKYYLNLTENNGGTDWGNWKRKYNLIKEDWLNIILILEHCLDNEDYDNLKNIWEKVNHFTDMYGYYSARLFWLDKILDQSKEKGDWETYSKSLSRSAWTLYVMGGKNNYREAIKNLEEAMGTIEKECVKEKSINSFNLKIQKLNILHHYVKVLLKDEKAYEKAYEKIKEQQRICDTFNEQEKNTKDKVFVRCLMNYRRDLAQYCLCKKDYKNAKKYYEEVLCLSRENDWQRGISITANNLADIEIENSGNLDLAEKYLTEVMDIAQHNEYEHRQARCNLSYAKLALKRDNKEQMYFYASQSREYYKKVDNEDRIKEIDELLSRVL